MHRHFISPIPPTIIKSCICNSSTALSPHSPTRDHFKFPIRPVTVLMTAVPAFEIWALGTSVFSNTAQLYRLQVTGAYISSSCLLLKQFNQLVATLNPEPSESGVNFQEITSIFFRWWLHLYTGFVVYFRENVLYIVSEMWIKCWELWEGMLLYASCYANTNLVKSTRVDSEKNPFLYNNDVRWNCRYNLKSIWNEY